MLLTSSALAQRYVAIFYFSSFGDTVYNSANLSPTGDSWIMQGQNPPYSAGGGVLNFWGKPLWAGTHGDGTIKNNYRFYFNGDANQPNNDLLDYHADLLSRAGVDLVVLDFSNGAADFTPNGPTYLTATRALCNRWQWRLNNGYPTPKIAFFVRNQATLATVESTYFNAYNPGLFFNYLGKKLLLVAQPNDALGQGDPNQPAVPTSGLFANYTARHCWGLDNSGSCWQFKVNSATPPQPFYYNGQPEQVCAPVATQATYMTTDGINPAPGAQGRQGGNYFTRYMDFARTSNAKFVFIHSWNEWNAGNWNTQAAPNFVDQWLTEYSADIEPMSGGHGWTYYDLMKRKVAEFKGLASFPLVSGHSYVLRARHSGKCAEVGGGITADGGNVNQYQIWNPSATCQRWTAYDVGGGYWKFINVNSGRCLEVAASSTAYGGNIQQWDWIAATCQQWSLADAGGGYWKIINRNSGLLVDVEGGPGATGDGINISQYVDIGGANQQWAFDEVSPIANGASYSLTALHSGRVADVQSPNTADGANIGQWDWNGNNWQKWRAVELGGGLVNLVSINSGKVMEVSGMSTVNGGNVQQWTSLGNTGQQWRLIGVDLGNVYEVMNANSGLVLDVAGISTANGANLQQWQWINGNNQKWRFDVH